MTPCLSRRTDDPRQRPGPAAFRRRLVGIVLLGSLLTATTEAVRAEVFCAATPLELQVALSFAATNGVDDEIRIATGNYPAPTNGYRYNAGFAQAEASALSISGGWIASGGDPCGLKGGVDPLQTVIDGGGVARPLDLQIRGTTEVTVRHLTFTNGSTSGDGGGLNIDHYHADTFTGLMHVEGNAFIGNQGGNGGGLAVRSSRLGTNARMVVTGNVLLENHANEDSGAMSLWALPLSTEIAEGSSLFVIGNTAMNNTTATIGETARAVYVVGSAEVRRVVANNLFWGNQGADLMFAGSGGYDLLHNNVDTLSGFDPALDIGNLSVAPQFEPCQGCTALIPAEGSALVDAGWVPGAGADWSLTTLDLDGVPRVRGVSVDIGAWENSSPIFNDGFDPH